MPQGTKTLKTQTKKMICDVYNFMSNEAKEGITNLKQVQKRTSAATKTSRSTVNRIIKEANLSTNSVTSFRTPGKKRSQSKPITGINDFDKGLIKRSIHNFHLTNKDLHLPTVQKLLIMLRNDINFQGSERSLRRIIKELGFCWRRTKDNRKILIENMNIRSKRIEYLQKIKKYRHEGRPIIYTDEACIHSTHISSKSWSDDSAHGLKKPISKGQRLVVIHAGSESGFIQKALLIFESGSKSGSCVDNINYESYQNWLQTQLIPNLPPNSIVVIDNTFYHNKEYEYTPTSNSRRADMQSWLTEKGISYSPEMLKPQLYKLIKLNKDQFKKFNIDKILSENNHEILRLPPYHPDLNPMKMAWAAIKGYVSIKNVEWNMKHVIELVKEKRDVMDQNEWKSLCEKIKQIEDLYVKSDHIIDDMTDEIIIQVGDTSDSDSDDLECSTASSDEDDTLPIPSS